MGSWNGTCGLSQMPIIAGEKAVLIPLLVKGIDVDGGGIHYSDDICSVISAPLFGEYNDYGAIDDITGPVEAVLDQFRTLMESGAITDSEGEIPETIDQLVEMIERGRIRNISFMLVSESIYHKVVKEIGDRNYYKKEYTIRENMEKHAQNYFQTLEKLSKSKDKGDELLFKTKLYAEKANPFASPFCSWKSHGFFDSFFDSVMNRHDEESISYLVDLRLFSIAMDLARKLWIPQAGYGSQCSEMMIQKIIAESVIEKEKRQREEYLKDCRPEDMEFAENITRETLFD